MEQQNKIVGIMGRKGSGKSTIARRILERCPALFVFDPMGEHVWVPNRLYDLDAVDRFLAWAEMQPTFAASFIPEWSVADDFIELADIIYDQGYMTFGIEEVPMLAGPTRPLPALDRLVRLGRHRGINLVWTAQRAAEVPRGLTAATDYFVLFRSTEPRDLDTLADRCGREVAEHVAKLGLHGFLLWDAMLAEETAFSRFVAEFTHDTIHDKTRAS